MEAKSISAHKEKKQENKGNIMDYKCKICQKIIISGSIKMFGSLCFCEKCFSKIKSNNAAPNIRNQDANKNLNDNNSEKIKAEVQKIKKYPDNSLLEKNNRIQIPSNTINDLKESYNYKNTRKLY